MIVKNNLNAVFFDNFVEGCGWHHISDLVKRVLPLDCVMLIILIFILQVKVDADLPLIVSLGHIHIWHLHLFLLHRLITREVSAIWRRIFHENFLREVAVCLIATPFFEVQTLIEIEVHIVEGGTKTE